MPSASSLLRGSKLEVPYTPWKMQYPVRSAHGGAIPKHCALRELLDEGNNNQREMQWGWSGLAMNR